MWTIGPQINWKRAKSVEWRLLLGTWSKWVNEFSGLVVTCRIRRFINLHFTWALHKYKWKHCCIDLSNKVNRERKYCAHIKRKHIQHAIEALVYAWQPDRSVALNWKITGSRVGLEDGGIKVVLSYWVIKNWNMKWQRDKKYINAELISLGYQNAILFKSHNGWPIVLKSNIN